jgi:prepilin-type N-terminal cleavage/methylation domain-containing protein
LRRIHRTSHRCLPGFTLIELLVVIAIIGLLIALVTAVASRAIGQQKSRNTQQIMQNVMLALEQFATEDPLHEVYARKGTETFGKYPPYQLDANADPADVLLVRHAVEANPLPGTLSTQPPTSLADRLWRDLGNRQGSPGDWVVINVRPGMANPDGYDDARALYAYLKLFSPESLNLVPEEYSKPLYPQLASADRSRVNPTGPASPGWGQPGSTWEDMLAFHDAWGVPLDYMLYVKVEWGLIRDPITGIQRTGYRVVERRPALRSLGIEREVYDAVVSAAPTPADRKFDPSKWLFSESLDSPLAGVIDYDTGELRSNPNPVSSANGWARAVGLAEDYAYLPAGDVEEEP